MEEFGVKIFEFMFKGDYNMRVNFIGFDVVLFFVFLFFYIFDDIEFDCRNLNEWLELGLVDGK